MAACGDCVCDVMMNQILYECVCKMFRPTLMDGYVLICSDILFPRPSEEVSGVQ